MPHNIGGGLDAMMQSENIYQNHSLYNQSQSVQNDFNRPLSTPILNTSNMYINNFQSTAAMASSQMLNNSPQSLYRDSGYYSNDFGISFEAPNVQNNIGMSQNIHVNTDRISPVQANTTNYTESQQYQSGSPIISYVAFGPLQYNPLPIPEITNYPSIQHCPQNHLQNDRPKFVKRKNTVKRVSIHVNSVCITCQTTKTTLWRRNDKGDPQCNACNLYVRTNERKRPAEYRNKQILKRKSKKHGLVNNNQVKLNFSEMPEEMKEFFVDPNEQ
uniref:GATA-type domain-containing protein n=1 Tax=Rhabditophanes sp. KR3021 TaxID=114890 RepID=A0AC35U7L4_9BILA